MILPSSALDSMSLGTVSGLAAMCKEIGPQSTRESYSLWSSPGEGGPKGVKKFNHPHEAAQPNLVSISDTPYLI